MAKKPQNEWRLTVRMRGGDKLREKVEKAACTEDRTVNWWIEKAVEEKLARTA